MDSVYSDNSATPNTLESDHSTTVLTEPSLDPQYVTERDSAQLLGEAETPAAQFQNGKNYPEGDTIDWFREEANARSHFQALRSGRGLRAALRLFSDNVILWLPLIASGIGIGLVGAWLDILVAWLSDIRLGRCETSILYNQATCCKGYEPGELCRDWLSWGDYFGIGWIGLQSLTQSFMYVALSIAFAASSAFLVQSYAPYAFHTGIPEIKAIIGGYVLDEFLSGWTLLIKAVGLALSVASGLSIGKEGPLVHVACCMAFLASSRFRKFKQNEAEKRRVLAAAAAAGVSVAFGSPLGGVLFALEELDVFHEEIMWRSFVTSAIAAVSLQYIDPFGTSKLVLFQVSAPNDLWRAFELIPFLILGVTGGMVGSIIIKLNVAATTFRQASQLRNWPLLEVVAVSGITAALSYLVVFMRVPTSELVANLFQECHPDNDYHGLCNSTALVENVFLLLISASMKVALTAWTFGMMIPAGIFLPTIAIGACIGRAIGLTVQAFHHLYPQSLLFATCPPDPTVRCISPAFYSVIGAAATLAGVTRMTISLVVILFELTGALSHVLPMMIAVMISKWVADTFGKDGIYAIWIAMRQYPWLSPVEFRDMGQKTESRMLPVERIRCIDERTCTFGSLSDLVHHTEHHGFPITRNGVLLGYATRMQLLRALETTELPDRDIPVVFVSRQRDDSEFLDFSALLETPALLLRKEIPLEFVVTVFQKMNLRYLLFTAEGRLTGLITKSDIAGLLTSAIPQSGLLAEEAKMFRQRSAVRSASLP